MNTPILELGDFSVDFVGRPPFRPVNRVSLAISKGEIFGLVGESGSGKTTLGRAIADLLPDQMSVSGCMRFDSDTVFSDRVDTRRALRGRKVAYVFQDPLAALDPTQRLGVQFAEMTRVHSDIALAPDDVLRRMGLTDVERAMRAYPHQLSGGMLQRMSLALSLLAAPDLVIADEVTSALDTTTKLLVLELLQSVAQDLGVALIVISHDLTTAMTFCHRVGILYGGELVEIHERDRSVKHPYSKALEEAAPVWEPARRLKPIEGVQRRFTALDTGCRFEERCPIASPACQEGWIDSLESGNGMCRCIKVQ